MEGHTPLWRGKVSVYHAKGVVATVISQKSKRYREEEVQEKAPFRVSE